MITRFIVYFLIYSLIGCIIDTTYTYIATGKLVKSGYFKYLPFCTLYGFGGIWLMIFFNYTLDLNPYLRVFLGGFLINAVEYIGGVFCENILSEKLWDYSNTFANLKGRISLQHAIEWLLLVGVYYFLCYSDYKIININFLDWLNVNPIIDVQLFLVFVLLGITLTLINFKDRQQRVDRVIAFCKRYLDKIH